MIIATSTTELEEDAFHFGDFRESSPLGFRTNKKYLLPNDIIAKTSIVVILIVSVALEEELLCLVYVNYWTTCGRFWVTT